jgi:hypothetical protein
MDLKIYYQKIRDEQEKIADPFPVVVSLETQDGGRAGVQTEVPKPVAARMIVDGIAKLASPTEAKAFRDAKTDAKAQADKAAEAAKLQFTVVPKKA